MRATRIVLDHDGFRVADVVCEGGPCTWSAEEPIGSLAMVLVRSGSFRRRVDGVELVADPMIAYLQRPRSIQQIAHPSGGDACTVIEPPESMLLDVVDSPERLSDSLVVRADLDVHHRALLARARLGVDAFEILERAAALAGRLLAGLVQERTPPSRLSSAAHDRALAGAVRELLNERSELGLGELARMVGLSPYRISRSFRRATGMTVTRYRRQLRMKQALQRFTEGDSNLARIAADLGFSDQAHFTRVARIEAGATPGQLRAMLSAPEPLLGRRGEDDQT